MSERDLDYSPVSYAGSDLTTFRVVDVRFPPFWADPQQPDGRWHTAGQGPCHYLATTPEGAWAEVIRHEALRDPEDVADLHRSTWVVEAPDPPHHVDVPGTQAALFRISYRRCQEAARRLRDDGVRSFWADSAALPKAAARVRSVGSDGRLRSARRRSEVVVVFGSAFVRGLQAQHATDGHPDPNLTDRVQHLPKKG
jgi:hypothetical protein